MRDVVFEVMLLKTELRGIDVERLGQQRAHVTHRFFALAQTNEIQNLGRIRKRVLNFLGEIRVAVLADRDVVDVGDLCAHRIQTRFDRKRGESRQNVCGG